MRLRISLSVMCTGLMKRFGFLANRGLPDSPGGRICSCLSKPNEKWLSMAGSIELLRLVICSLAIAVVSGNTVFSQTKIPASAIEGWQEMAKVVETIQFTMRYSDGKKSIIDESSCFIQGSMEKCEYLNSDKVVIRNGRGFDLGRNSNGKWRLFGIHGTGDRMAQLQNSLSVAKVGFSLHGSATLLDILGNPEYSVPDWRELTDGSGNVEMQVLYTINNDLKTVYTAVLVLQPEKRFRVLSASYDDGDGKPSVYVSEYKDDSILAEVVPTRHYFKKYEREWVLLSISNKTLPESEFSISHYGLPEYIEPTRRTNWWLWLFLVSTLCMVIGVLWKRRGR